MFRRKPGAGTPERKSPAVRQLSFSTSILGFSSFPCRIGSGRVGEWRSCRFEFGAWRRRFGCWRRGRPEGGGRTPADSPAGRSPDRPTSSLFWCSSSLRSSCYCFSGSGSSLSPSIPTALLSPASARTSYVKCRCLVRCSCC